METVRWCEGGGDARKDSEREGDRSWEKLREGGRFGVRGEEGGRMSAKKAIYIRQKTVPPALTATRWHRCPLCVCLSRHTCVNPQRYAHLAPHWGCMGTFNLRQLLHVCLTRHEILHHKSVPWLPVFISGTHIHKWTQKNLSTHRHMRIGFELWNVWNLITQLHNDSATGHLETPLAVRPGHGCGKGWGSLVPHFCKVLPGVFAYMLML